MSSNSTTDGVVAVYDKFDAWTQRTGILDGSGLTWIARIPINLVIIVVGSLTEIIIFAVRRLLRRSSKCLKMKS